MKKLFLLLAALMLLVPGCVSYCRWDSGCEGRVVDADTGEPLQGVVILGTWHVVQFGGYGRFYDARETMTDKNGEFRIPGQGLRIFSNLEPVDLTIFKAGYQYEKGTVAYWKAGYEESNVKWEGNKAIIPLKKLSLKERKSRLIGKEELVPDKKQRLLIKELNKESKELGEPLYPEVN